MAIILDLRPEIENRLQAEATAKGLSLGKLVEKVVEDHAAAVEAPGTSAEIRERLMLLAKKWHEIPTLDRRGADEIIGFDKYGLPS